MSRGGAREGAGRPSTGNARVNVCARVTPETRRWLYERAQDQGISVGQLIDGLVKQSGEH